MTESNNPMTASDVLSNDFQRLTRQLKRGRGQFALLFARWNHPGEETPIVAKLRSECDDMRILSVDVSELPFDRFYQGLIKAQNSAADPDAIFVFGLEKAFPDFVHATEDDRPPILSVLNMQRELMRYHLRGPLVLWLPDHVLNLIAQKAPDFWSWRSGIFEFELPEGRGHFLVSEIREITSKRIPMPVAEIQPKIDQLMSVWNDIHSPQDGIPRREWETAADIAEELVLLHQRCSQFDQAEKWRNEAVRLLQELRVESIERSERFARYSCREGNLRCRQSSGISSENIRKSIACYEDALSIYSEANFPTDWAKTQSYLGWSWLRLPSGDRPENLLRAIASYNAALRVYTETNFPSDWAMIQSDLGWAWANLAKGDRSENLKNAIVCYEASSRVLNETDFPVAWASTQYCLGFAWANLARGSYSENLTKAIGFYEAAIRVYSETDFPIDRARIQNNLGWAWSMLPSGDSENLQKAIVFFDAAAKVLTETNFPSDWARIQHNLGRTWLLSGDNSQNIKNAIVCLEAASRVYTETNFPGEWAEIQHRLGVAWSNLSSRDHNEDFRKAINCFEAALRVYTETDWVKTWKWILGRRGDANQPCRMIVVPVQGRVGLENGGNKPIREVRWDQSSGNLDVHPHAKNTEVVLLTGLKPGVNRLTLIDPDSNMEVYQVIIQNDWWADTQNNLGLAWSKLLTGDRNENLRKAIACHKAALCTYPKANLSSSWARTQNNLGSAYQSLSEIDEPLGNKTVAVSCFEAAERAYRDCRLEEEAKQARTNADQLRKLF